MIIVPSRDFDRRDFYRSQTKNYDPAIIRWKNAVLSRGGGYVSQNTLQSLNWFYKELKKTSFFPKLKSVNVHVPDNLIAATTPIISVIGTVGYTIGGFVNTDLSIRGLVGNGSSKYLLTGINPSIHIPTVNSAGITIYLSTASATNTGCEAGGGDGSQWTLYHYNGTMYADCWSSTGAGRVSASISSFAGYLSANRIASNDFKVFRANSTISHVQIASSTGITGARPNREISEYAMNDLGSGGRVQYSNKTHSFSAYHEGLTVGESGIFFQLIHKMRQKLGGGFV